jgi:hypothetical protein
MRKQRCLPLKTEKGRKILGFEHMYSLGVMSLTKHCVFLASWRSGQTQASQSIAKEDQRDKSQSS